MKTQRTKLHLILGTLICALIGQYANAQSIFHCSQTAGPGDVIGIQGNSFGNKPQVWMHYVTGTEASLVPTQQLTVLSSTGSTDGTSTSSYVSALIPVNEAPGLYAIWVSSNGGSTFSSGVYINRAVAEPRSTRTGNSISTVAIWNFPGLAPRLSVS